MGEADQCVGKGAEGEDGQYAAGYKKFVSCNDRSNMTTREPIETSTPEPTSAPKGNDDDDETWLIVGSIFIALFGVTVIGIIVYCFTQNYNSSASGYQRGGTNDVET